MSLLKTVLLSTTLMIGTAFGSENLTAAEGSVSANRSDAQVFADTLSEIREENAQYLDMIKKLVSKVHTGEVVSTNRGEFVDLIQALSKGLNATIKGKTQLESDLETAKGQLTTATAANEKLTAEKAAAEAALVTATEQLAAVITAKDAVDEKLAAAGLKVAALTEELNTVKTAKDEADTEAAGAISGLDAQLAAAKTQVEDLTTKANELEDWKAKAEKTVKESKTSLATMLSMARVSINAAIAPNFGHQSDHSLDLGERLESLTPNDDDEEYEENADFFAGFDKAPLGIGDVDGSPRSELSSSLMASPEVGASSDNCVTHASVARNLEFKEVDPETAAQIAKLQTELAKAQTATTASPHSGKGCKNKNEKAQAAAAAEVKRITADLKKLGVDVTAAASN